jgi:drug/metabolite transporter (DMT)-like permease
MSASETKSASPILVILAFAIVYLVWGSTYLFIQIAVKGFPPFILGAFRFILAGLIMAIWCIIKGEKLVGIKGIKHAAFSGILLLFFGTGIVIWVEQSMPSAMVAITVSSAPLWFVLLDKPKWSENFKSKSIIAGMLIGLAGVILLFSEQISQIFSVTDSTPVKMSSMILLLFAAITWAGGSLYSKYRSAEGPIIVSTTWQIMAAGIAFIPGIFIRDEFSTFQWREVPSDSWFALAYLVSMGSIAGFSAYVWLLQVRTAMQVSTHSYVNPVVAVLLGVFFANEKITGIQIAGLFIILGSVFLINMAKYRREKLAERVRNS